jgi:hypothetical protein
MQNAACGAKPLSPPVRGNAVRMIMKKRLLQTARALGLEV